MCCASLQKVIWYYNIYITLSQRSPNRWISLVLSSSSLQSRMNAFCPMSTYLSFLTWLLPYCRLFFRRWPILLLDVTEVLDGGCRIHPEWCFGSELRPGRCQWRHLVTFGKQPPFCLSLPLDQFLNAFADEVNHLADAH